MKVEAVIVAAGKGVRFGNNQPKQFLPLVGKSVVEWTILRFENCPSVNSVILVVPEGMKERLEEKICFSKYRKLRKITEGGKERTDSVYKGLLCVDEDTDIVLVHDGVRPLVSPLLIEEVIRQTEIYGAAIPGIPVKETIKEKDKEGMVVRTLPREKIFLIQTPQGFKYSIIKDAHEQAQIEHLKGSDDAFLLEKLGWKVKIIPGEEKNIKITTFFDFKIAEMLLREEERKR
ncbi:2-C-methyl-D-erythritol 4-phosphate cytidylyltransferase [Candidatus Aerophobetes bacterium]|nr:2-C-methyl-D-erythritol 4-phosphate cytidylyltransferase [Candidatus Aerophobetes bacterium]